MWRQADYHWLRHFLCADFLHFIALNAIWPHFLGIKPYFYQILCPLNMLNKTKLMRNGWEKKLVFWRESRRVGRSLIIVNKSVKETENLMFSVSDQILFHSWTPKLVFSLLVKILHLVFIQWNKIRSYAEKNQISSIYSTFQIFILC